MYIVQSKERFLTSEEAIQFILSVIAEAGLEDEFKVVEIRDDLCGMIKDLWSSEENVSKEFKELSEELIDPVQKLHAKNLSKEYERHKVTLRSESKIKEELNRLSKIDRSKLSVASDMALTGAIVAYRWALGENHPVSIV